MKRLWPLAALLLLLPFVWPSGAAANAEKQQAGSAPRSATMFKKFSSSFGPGTVVRVSTDGNVIGFASPTGLDHIAAGIVVEGYVLCYKNPNSSQNVNAYDVASAASGFGASSQSANPLTIVRTTSDGILRLTQTFKFSGMSRSLQITMTVKNISGQTVTNVGLRRQVDFDVDAGGKDGTGNFDNLFGTTIASVFAYDDSGGSAGFFPPGQHGMLLRSLNVKVGATSYGTLTGAATSSVADTDCMASVDPTPAGPVDDGATFNVLPILTLPAGGTLTETIEYDAF